MWEVMKGFPGYLIARPVCRNVIILFLFSLRTVMGFCWIGLVPLLGFACLFSGLSLGPRLNWAPRASFPLSRSSGCFCLSFCLHFLASPAWAPFPFMVAVPDILGTLGLACRVGCPASSLPCGLWAWGVEWILVSMRMGVRGLAANVPVFCAQCSGGRSLFGDLFCYLACLCHLTMVFPEFLTFVSALSFQFTQFPLEFALVAS